MLPHQSSCVLVDVLTLSLRKGSIGVKVSPKASDESDPLPAKFLASSDSGSIHASFEMDGYIPERDYQTRVESRSGTISGGYIFTSLADFTSTSGSIAVDALPYCADARSYLHSETRSSHQSLHVMPPYQANGTSLSRLHSSHKSTAGSLDLVYPQEWVGSIDGSTASGSLNVKGKDVECFWKGGLDGGKRFVGRKGYGESRIDFRTASGSIMLKVGDY